MVVCVLVSMVVITMAIRRNTVEWELFAVFQCLWCPCTAACKNFKLLGFYVGHVLQNNKLYHILIKNYKCANFIQHKLKRTTLTHKKCIARIFVISRHVETERHTRAPCMVVLFGVPRASDSYRRGWWISEQVQGYRVNGCDIIRYNWGFVPVSILSPPQIFHSAMLFFQIIFISFDILKCLATMEVAKLILFKRTIALWAVPKKAWSLAFNCP